MPEIRAILYQPWRCLCLGLRLQMMRVTPLRLTTLQCSQIGFTLLRTFTKTPSCKTLDFPAETHRITGLVS